jgi:hypothetical protein
MEFTISELYCREVAFSRPFLFQRGKRLIGRWRDQKSAIRVVNPFSQVITDPNFRRANLLSIKIVQEILVIGHKELKQKAAAVQFNNLMMRISSEANQTNYQTCRLSTLPNRLTQTKLSNPRYTPQYENLLNV